MVYPKEFETYGLTINGTWALVLGVFSSLVTIGDWLNRLIINDFNIEDANMKKPRNNSVIIAVCGAALWEHHQLIDKPKVPIK